MATWRDVRRVALSLPEVVERTSRDGVPEWRVRSKLFAWERPLRRADLAELGDLAPTGPVLAARVKDVGAKAALLAEEPHLYFTTSHFDGYPAILARLDRLRMRDLRELLVEAWLDRAPKTLVARFRR